MSLQSRTENSRNLIFYFQVHQPRRLRAMHFFDIGSVSGCFDDELNKDIMKRVASTCYLPTNALLLKLIKKHPEIRLSFSISGITLEQFEQHAPEVLDSFRALADTGAVEFLCETYYHSLACLMPGHEFEIQALKHAEAIEKYFGKRPTVFRNTELIYNDEVGKRVSMLGFNGIFTDGIQKVVTNKKSVHQLYQHPNEADMKILLRDYLLSDDIAFRFSQNGSRLTAEKYMAWLSDIPASEKVVTVAMDYETFGEHQKKETGILDFLKKLFPALAKSQNHRMLTPTEAINMIEPHATLSVPDHISWADQERDLSAWLGNDMQKDAFESLKKLDREVKSLGNPEILKQWRTLQTSDHFYYMSTKNGSDGTVHNYFSPYPSPYEAFINYMNVLTDFSLLLKSKKSTHKPNEAKRIKRLSSPLQEVEV
jgi:alpha-amylase